MRIAALAFIVFIGGLSGCKTADKSGSANDLNSSSRKLVIPGTDIGDMPFEFCPQKKSFSLTNAMWLTYLAANQYSHFKEIGPLLEKLGFGDPGEGQAYRRAWFALRIKRIQASLIDKDDEWTNESERLSRLASVKAEYAQVFGSAYVDDGVTAAAFEEKLVSPKASNAKIQFFSGFTRSATGEASKDSTQAFYAEHNSKNFSVLSFRGTEVDEELDKTINNKSDHVPLAGMGLVHTGFLSGEKQVEDGIVALLKARSAVKPINLWITGHSLGAALATLATARLMLMKESGQLPNVNLMGTYHIGSPRVGDADFASKFDAMTAKYKLNMVRFRNHHDLVTVIPFGLPFKPGYWHVGALAYFSEEGQLFYGDGWKKIEDESDYKKGLATSIENHSAATYFSLTKRAYEENLNSPLTDCTVTAGERPLQPFRENPASR